MNGPIRWMIRNRVTANLLMVFILVAGSFGAISLRKQVFPELNIPRGGALSTVRSRSMGNQRGSAREQRGHEEGGLEEDADRAPSRGGAVRPVQNKNRTCGAGLPLAGLIPA